MLAAQPFLTLNDGRDMPLMGLGTWQSAPGEVKTAVEAALRAGYRHLDCAHFYKNESEVGVGMQTVFQEGTVTRQDVFVTSKLWNDDHASSRVRAACLLTLKALQLEYLDLYLIHWPCTGVTGSVLTPSLEETWKAMEALVDEGLVKSIGVSNCSAVKIQGILDMARIVPAVNQVEAHPYFTNNTLLQWCRSKGIILAAYSPLGSPDSAAVLQRDSMPNLLGDAVVVKIASDHHKNPGQVLIRWGLQRGTAVLPKSSRPERIVSNFDVMDWSLSDKDMEDLDKLETHLRMVKGSGFTNPDGPYKVVEDLWDDQKMARMEICA